MAAPEPPCGGPSFPSYPDVDHPPAIKAWVHDELGRDWMPPPCTGWTEPGFSMLVVTAARFRYESGTDGLLRHIGAVSRLKGMPYWSTTHQRWQTLIVDAYALSGPTGERRGDFAPGELTEGAHVYFSQEDSLSGKGTYEMRVKAADPDKLVFETRNASTLRLLMVPVFHPGDVQSIYFLERESKDVWRYYNIVRLGEKANSLIAGHAASSINRAVAFYRYLAGIPGDQEPPAAR
jgi:hypothetical protein